MLQRSGTTVARLYDVKDNTRVGVQTEWLRLFCFPLWHLACDRLHVCRIWWWKINLRILFRRPGRGRDYRFEVVFLETFLTGKLSRSRVVDKVVTSCTALCSAASSIQMMNVAKQKHLRTDIASADHAKIQLGHYAPRHCCNIVWNRDGPDNFPSSIQCPRTPNYYSLESEAAEVHYLMYLATSANSKTLTPSELNTSLCLIISRSISGKTCTRAWDGLRKRSRDKGLPTSMATQVCNDGDHILEKCKGRCGFETPKSVSKQVFGTELYSTYNVCLHDARGMFTVCSKQWVVNIQRQHAFSWQWVWECCWSTSLQQIWSLFQLPHVKRLHYCN